MVDAKVSNYNDTFDTGASVGASFINGGTPYIAECSNSNPGCTLNGVHVSGLEARYSGTLSGTVTSNTQYSVEVYAEATATLGYPASMYAYADPQIFIDPSFADAGSYSLVLSPGVGNALNGVPEPSTLLMMGMAAAASVRVRRRSLRRHAG